MEYIPSQHFVRSTHTVPDGVARQRLSDYANGLFAELPSRKAAKKAISRGLFCIDGSVADSGRWVEPGMLITLLDDIPVVQKVFDCPMPVVFEDDYMAVVAKPAGLPVSGNYYHTVQNALPPLLSPSTQIDAMPIPRPVHRLDSPTSGLLAVAKTYGVARILGEQFAERSAEKTYYAVVCGRTPLEGTCCLPIEGQEASSSYRQVGTARSLRYGTVSLMELVPYTGRTHQLRIHCARLGWPIYGDTLYGNTDEIVAGKGLFLAACKLSLSHPVTGNALVIEMAIPEKFASLFERENRRFEKFNQV